jgi:flagellar protein FliS
MTNPQTRHYAANAYRNAAVVVSPLAGVVMLFDGVVLNLRRTVSAIEARHPEEAFNHLNRAVTILRGLSGQLDFVRGGSVAKRMHETYVRLIMSALNSFGKADSVVRYGKLIDGVLALRDAWSAVRRQGIGAEPGAK